MSIVQIMNLTAVSNPRAGDFAEYDEICRTEKQIRDDSCFPAVFSSFHLTNSEIV